jgi:hypothetical protein
MKETQISSMADIVFTGPPILFFPGLEKIKGSKNIIDFVVTLCP